MTLVTILYNSQVLFNHEISQGNNHILYYLYIIILLLITKLKSVSIDAQEKF